MPEPTTTLTRDAIQSDLGIFLGWGGGAFVGERPYTTLQQNRLNQATTAGLSTFYSAHDWTFLSPTTELTLPSGEWWIPLPDDYGYLDGSVVLSTTSSSSARSFWPIRVTQPPEIDYLRSLQSDAQIQTTPTLCAIEPEKGTTMTRSNRYRILFYPTPDADYTVKIDYRISPDALSGLNPYAYGGGIHSETLKQAVRAAAETLFDSRADGPQNARYMMLLAQSKANDNRARPQNLGYNRDRSDALHNNGLWPWRYPPVYVNGSIPSAN